MCHSMHARVDCFLQFPLLCCGLYQADERLAAREKELEEEHQARVEMLETDAAQLRKQAAFDKDALARNEARAKELQRELLSAREVCIYVASSIA